MQWRDVSFEELFSALREADVSRVAGSEFLRLGAFNLPADGFGPRLKCNLWYYRSNYAAIVVLVLIAVNVRRPLSLLAVLLLLLGVACLSDVVARKLSQRVTRLVRRVNPRLGERLRVESAGRTGLGAPGKGGANIAGLPRAAVVAVCCVTALLVFWRARTIARLAWACSVGLGLVLAHATLRAPNLKARLAEGGPGRAREEFRAVWRGYAAAGGQHDYNA